MYATATGTIVPGDTLVPGSQCDDCLAPITLPFAYTLYGQTATSVEASSNGQLDFVTGDSQYANSCLPDTVASYAIFPNWDDLDTSGTGHGVYTSVTGVAPNRIFNIEWRAEYYPATGTANFEVRLYEGQSRFDLVYGTMSDAGNGATVGVQSDTGSHYTEFECNTGGLTSGLVITFTQPGCGGSTETPTPVPGTPTATATTGGPTSTPLPPTATATPAGCQPGPWTVADPRPAAVEGTTMDHDGTYAYAAGGYDGTDVTNYFVRYNPVADSWDTLTPMPTPADGTGVVYSPVNNKVYVFGGADGPGNAEDVTRIYDVAAGTWSLGATMPGPRNRYAAVGYYNGIIYVVGGSTDLSGTTAQPNTWSYDPATDTWDTSLMDMPTAIGEAAYGIVDGHIYVLGGKDTTQTTVDTVYDYDIATDMWTTKSSVEPVAVSQAGRAVVDGRIWVFGGDNGLSSRRTRRADAPAVELSVTQIYDPSSDTWSAGPDLNVARYGVGGTYLAPYIISSAGYTAANEESVTEVIVDTCITPTATPVAGTTTATPTTAPPTDTPVPGASSTPAPTNTPAAPTATPAATETPCALPFSDVHDDRLLLRAGAVPLLPRRDQRLRR